MLINNKSDSRNTPSESFIEQIKAFELAIARRITLVQEETEHSQVIGKAETIELCNTIEEAGKIEANARYQTIIDTAHTQAGLILTRAQQDSAQLMQHLPQLISQTNDYAFKLIMGTQDKE